MQRKFRDFVRPGQHVCVDSYFDGVPVDKYAGDVDGMVRIFYQLAKTVSSVHRRGVFHFDLKPDNVLVNKNGQIFVIDFGSAQICTAKTICKCDVLTHETQTTTFAASTPMFSSR